MKIALVHDFLREYGGAERVLEVLHEMWPEAPVYTSFVDWPSFAKAPAGKVELFKSWDIRTSPVADNWLIKKFHSPLRFLAPWIWKSIDVSDYDVVISSSGWFMCRGVKAGRRNPTNPTNNPIRPINELMKQFNNKTIKPLHICYIHHPPRNLYGYATGSNFQKYWPVRVYASIINFFLRHYDFETAQKVDYFIANSKETARRVEKFYRRESVVIYPPIEISKGLSLRMQGETLKKKEYFLSVGRLTYSKRIDLAIEACMKLGLWLKIVGSGKEEAYLRNLASQGLALRSKVEFLGSVSDEELGRLYAGAKALIFCALDEDFGMVPVEAMAQGTPVIALGQGGVLETVIDGNPSTSSGLRPSSGSEQRTGILFSEQTTESLVEAIKRFQRVSIDSKTCIAQAKKFSKDRFKKELRTFVVKFYSLTR